MSWRLTYSYERQHCSKQVHISLLILLGRRLPGATQSAGTGDNLSAKDAKSSSAVARDPSNTSAGVDVPSDGVQVLAGILTRSLQRHADASLLERNAWTKKLQKDQGTKKGLGNVCDVVSMAKKAHGMDGLHMALRVSLLVLLKYSSCSAACTHLHCCFDSHWQVMYTKVVVVQ